ncbi:MAG: class I SAM-dependent methyltransferase [bacterium]|nr:class I SAM-dependent methyltransferase [bacterium]
MFKKQIPVSRKIVKDLFSLYSHLNFKVRLYLRIRWLLTPFETVEKYVPKQGLILDLGSGYGIFSNLLNILSDNRSVIGIDLSEQRTKIAQLTVGDRYNIRFLKGDLKTVELSPCDVITLYAVLHHMNYKAQEDLLNQCAEKLKQKGILIIKDNDTRPYWKYLLNYVHELAVMYLLGVKGDRLSFRTPEDFKSLLIKIGFSIDTIRLKTYLPYPFILYICKKR